MGAAGVAAPAVHGWAPEAGRFRTAICAYSFRKGLQDQAFTYANLIRMAAELGADGIDLTTYWLPDTSDQTLFGLKKLAYRSGVALYTIGIRARMAQPTPELQAAEIELVRKWLDVAVRLGASHMRIFGGAVPKGATEDQAVAWAVETLKRAAEDAGKKGVILGVEDDGGITTNADRTVEIVKKADSPWVGINLDIGHFTAANFDALGYIRAYHADITNLHLKDRRKNQGDNTAWGEGETPIREVLQLLKKEKWPIRAYVEYEYKGSGSSVDEVKKCFDYARQALA